MELPVLPTKGGGAVPDAEITAFSNPQRSKRILRNNRM